MIILESCPFTVKEGKTPNRQIRQPSTVIGLYLQDYEKFYSLGMVHFWGDYVFLWWTVHGGLYCWGMVCEWGETQNWESDCLQPMTIFQHDFLSLPELHPSQIGWCDYVVTSHTRAQRMISVFWETYGGKWHWLTVAHRGPRVPRNV